MSFYRLACLVLAALLMYVLWRCCQLSHCP